MIPQSDFSDQNSQLPSNSAVRGLDNKPRVTTSLDDSVSPVSLVNRAGFVVRQELGADFFSPRLALLHPWVRLIPYRAGNRLRTAFYRFLGFEIGKGTLIYGPLDIWGDVKLLKNLQIGELCRINRRCHMDLNGQITIEDRVVLGPDVTLLTASHEMTHPLSRAGRHIIRPITIQEGAWIAAHVIILPGVTVGAGAVVGAGSVVTKDVPPHTLVAGNPARVIKQLPTEIEP